MERPGPVDARAPSASSAPRSPASRARSGTSGDYDDALALVGRRPRGLLGLDLGVLRGPRVRAVRAGARPARDARRAMVPGRAAVLRRARLPRPRRRRGRDPPRLASCASWSSGRGASCARRPRAIAAGLRALGRRAGRPRRRLHAEHPRDGRRVPGVRVARRDLVVRSPDFGARAVVDRFAQIEPKVLLAVDGYRYGGTRLRPPRGRRRPRATRSRRARRAPRLPRRLRAGRRISLGRARAADVRSSCRSTTRCGSSTPRARRGCRRRSSTARAASCSSISRSSTCMSTRRRATASSGSRRPAG